MSRATPHSARRNPHTARRTLHAAHRTPHNTIHTLHAAPHRQCCRHRPTQRSEPRLDRFAARGGVAYQKQLWSTDKVTHAYTWQTFFFTSDLHEAKRQVVARDPNARVGDDGSISFSEVLPATPAHPITGEPTWFNGVHTNHRSYYEDAAHVDTSAGSPMDTEYADGSPIEEQTIALIRAAYWNHSVAVQMEGGDIAFVDNMLAAHGRMGWVPGHPRKVLLAHFSDATW